MKKILITLTLVAATSAGFAQGKIAMQNGTTTPIILSSTDHLAADASLAGQAVGQSVPLLSGVTLVAGLYAGTSSGALSLYAPNIGDSRGFLLNQAGGTAGLIPLTQYAFNSPLILGNVAAFAQIKVWDSTYASYEATPLTAYRGETSVFPFTTKTSYASIAASILPQSPIVVAAVIPEPTTAAIAGLGLASMLLFRRKKA